jgi:hypothetical protein
MFMCPQRPLYVARGKILHYVYDDYIINCFPFCHSYIFMSLMFTLTYPINYMYLSTIFSDHAVIIFPQPDRIHVRF